MWRRGILIGVGLLALMVERSQGETMTGELIVFHAGSLSAPLREVSRVFMQKYPGVKVKAEAAGSLDTARKVSDLGRPCDVLGSADYKVVEDLLLPKHTAFNIRFATNELSIAYTAKSALGEAITAANWSETLLRKKVIFGRADPNRDPCGYRTLMMFQLAEKHYKAQGLAAQLVGKHGQRFIRPKETDLLALLEAGEIDYLFIYRSVAIQHGLRFVALPDEINLKSARLKDLYRTASVKIAGKEPGQFVTYRGEPMCYSVTIPKNAPHRALAEAYVELLLSPAGQAIMEASGQPAINPPQADGYERLPKQLKALCLPVEVVGNP